LRHGAPAGVASLVETIAAKMIIHLNGWPGTGKQTVGRELATRIGARLIHNHLLHDISIVCCGRTTPERWELYETIRTAVYGYLQNIPSSETLVMTNALCNGSEREVRAWTHVVELAISRSTADPELSENVRRLQSAERSNKLRDQTILMSYLHVDSIQQPDVRELLVLDATALSPEEADTRILQHVEEVREWVLPATEKHMILR
jgi:cytidylate kinase